jgi:hypothetical protein
VQDGWTLTELAALAARALVDADVQVTSGRVTGVPDGRLIRWYTTIGLLDRPAIGSDRHARYGTRHLLQLVAVKRLQAQGLPIAQIQAMLAGATDAQLRRVADLPQELTEAGAVAAPADGGRFWARRPAAANAVTGAHAANEDVTRLYGLNVGGLHLLLPAEPATDDLDAIAAAARPLLHLLADRGLINTYDPDASELDDGGVRHDRRSPR